MKKDIGVITGADYRRCACCGGWFVEIEGNRYRFESLPEGNALDLFAENFPLDVVVDWESSKNLCLGDEIVVLDMEKIQ